MLLGVRSIRSWQPGVPSSSRPTINGEAVRRLQHERRRRNGPLGEVMTRSSAGGGRAGRRIRWASSRRHRRLVVDGATALRHLLSMWRKTTRGEESRGRGRGSDGDRSTKMRMRTLYNLFSNLPVSRRMVSSADEESIPRSPQQLNRFHVSFNLQISTITWPSGKREE
jgi:hypothetical protein